MNSSAPEFSFVIPTRNRPHRLALAASSVLNQTGAYRTEIVISDNSDMSCRDEVRRVAAKLSEEGSGTEVRYVSTPETLPMHDSWDFAIGHARGEWVTVLGDDDAVSPDLLFRVGAVAGHSNSPVISWRTAHYYDEDGPKRYLRNAYIVHGCSGNASVHTSALALQRLFRLQPDATLPRTQNAFVQRSIYQGICARYGRTCWAPAPDFTAGIAVLAHVDQYVHIDEYLGVSGSGAGSPHESSDAFARFISEFPRLQLQSDAPIPILSPCNQNASPLMVMKSVLQDELLDFSIDKREYSLHFWSMILDHEEHGFDMSLERHGLTKFVREEFRLCERRILRLAFRWTRLKRWCRALLRQGAIVGPFDWILRLSNLRIVQGSAAGFGDVYGAAVHLPTNRTVADDLRNLR